MAQEQAEDETERKAAEHRADLDADSPGDLVAVDPLRCITCCCTKAGCRAGSGPGVPELAGPLLLGHLFDASGGRR